MSPLVYSIFSLSQFYASIRPLHLFTESTTFSAQPPLITSMSLNHCLCTPPSPTTLAPNANTGLALPIIISTLSEAEGNMQQILKSLQLPGSWMSLLLRLCLYRPHDNWDTETVCAVAPAHPASPKIPLCVSIVDVVEQEMTVNNHWIKGQWVLRKMLQRKQNISKGESPWSGHISKALTGVCLRTGTLHISVLLPVATQGCTILG